MNLDRSPVLRVIGGFLIVGLLTVMAYWPGLSGGFVFDDFPNIVLNPKIQITSLSPATLTDAALSSRAGPLMRPVSIATLAINHFYSGLNPFSYKVVNVLIHVLTAVSVGVLARALLADPSRLGTGLTPRTRDLIAFGAAVAFALHPFNLTSVLYVVQRMTSLAALFTFVSIASYVQARRIGLIRGRLQPALPWFFASVAALGMGMLSKESSVAALLLLPLTEWVAFGFSSRSPRFRGFLKVASAAAVMLFLAVLVVEVGVTPEAWAYRYWYRDFTLSERVLTEARVVVFYLAQTLLPRVNDMSLFHDDITISTGLLSPVTTLISMLVLLGLGAIAVAFRRTAPILTFGIGWFLAGHILESSVIPLELVHEHRNYLPVAGLMIALAVLAGRAAKGLPARKVAPVAAFPLVVLALLTFARASTWSDPVTHALVEAKHKPESPRAVYSVAYAYHGMYLMRGEHEFLDLSLEWLERAARVDEKTVGPLFDTLRVASQADTPVEPSVYDRLAERLATKRIHPADIDYFRRTVDCFKGGVCNGEPDSLLRLFGAALSNEWLYDREKAQLLITLADLYVSYGDPDAALRVMHDVVRIAPEDHNNHLNLARAQYAAGRHEEARITLSRLEAKMHDTGGFDPFQQVGLDDVSRVRAQFE